MDWVDVELLINLTLWPEQNKWFLEELGAAFASGRERSAALRAFQIRVDDLAKASLIPGGFALLGLDQAEVRSVYRDMAKAELERTMREHFPLDSDAAQEMERALENPARTVGEMATKCGFSKRLTKYLLELLANAGRAKRDGSRYARLAGKGGETTGAS